MTKLAHVNYPMLPSKDNGFINKIKSELNDTMKKRQMFRTETYDGTTWSTDISMSAERYGGVCAGSGASSGVVASGDTDTTAVLTTTEEVAETLTARAVTDS